MAMGTLEVALDGAEFCIPGEQAITSIRRHLPGLAFTHTPCVRCFVLGIDCKSLFGVEMAQGGVTSTSSHRLLWTRGTAKEVSVVGL
jgi:hypothetical protein